MFIAGLLNLDLALLHPTSVSSRQLAFVWIFLMALSLFFVNRFQRWRLGRCGVEKEIDIEAPELLGNDFGFVLYLRSFEVDEVTAALDSLEGSGLQFFVGPNPLTQEQNIEVALSFVGPVYAIGDPRRHDKSGNITTCMPGVTKIYLKNDKDEKGNPGWYSDVSRHMKKAKLVAVVPGSDLHETAGVVWELRELKKRNYLDKTVILLPTGESYYEFFKTEMGKLKIFDSLPLYPKRLRQEPGPLRAVLYFTKSGGKWTSEIGLLNRRTLNPVPLWEMLSRTLAPVFNRVSKTWNKGRAQRMVRWFATRVALGLVAISGLYLFPALWAVVVGINHHRP